MSLFSHRRFRLVMLLNLLFVVAAGCDPSTSYEEPETDANKAPGSAETQSDVAGKVRETGKPIELEKTNSVHLAQFIQSRTDSKVVLVDHWATWCAPCIKKLPQVNLLYQQYRNRGLEVVAVSMNEPGEAESVKEFLAKRDLEFPQLIADKNNTDAFEDFQIESVPFYRVYRTTGELLQEFSGKFEFSEIEVLIKRELETTDK